MNVAGVDFPKRLVTEAPYFLSSAALAEIPSLRANPRRRLIPAGPGAPTRIGTSIPRPRTSATHFATAVESNETCVVTDASMPARSRAASFCSSASHRVSSAISGWPSGYPVMPTSRTPNSSSNPDWITDSASGNGPTGVLGSPPTRNSRSTAPTADSRFRYSRNSSAPVRRRAAMCGPALSPAPTIACAASMRISVVSLPRYVRLTAVPAGIDLDAVSSDSVSFAVISREKFFSSSREPMVCSVIVSVLPVVLTSKGRIRGRLDHGLHGDLAVLLHSRLRRDRVFAPQHLYFG